jgi:hypothetical protein
VNLDMAFDGTIFVQRSITEARETLLITAGLVILIIFLFWRRCARRSSRRWRSRCRSSGRSPSCRR